MYIYVYTYLHTYMKNDIYAYVNEADAALLRVQRVQCVRLVWEFAFSMCICTVT